jgi:anti-sigma regulatory factor (Ser/Thr protein kinase)
MTMNRWSTEPLMAHHSVTGRCEQDADVLSRRANPDGCMNERRTTTVGSVAGLRAMRRRLADWLDELGVDLPMFVADVQLAAVEVVTNAFVHSLAATVDVSLEIVDDDVVTTIEHSSPIPTPTHASVALPGVDSVTGRGLFVVDQIARSRTVFHTGVLSTTRLDIPLPRQG